MHRRSFVACLGTATLAGCLGNLPFGGPTPTISRQQTAGTSSSKTKSTPDEFQVSEFNVSTTKVAPPKRYLAEISGHYSEDAVKREEGEQTIREVSEITNSTHRAFIKTVISEGRIWREKIPAGVQELTEQVDFFIWKQESDDASPTYLMIDIHWGHPDRDPVLDLSAELVDDRIRPSDPGEVAFTLSHSGDVPQILLSGPVPPFSVLRANHQSKNLRALLWRNYFPSDHVTTWEYDYGTGLFVDDIIVPTWIDPGESIRKEYELRSTFDRLNDKYHAFDTPGRYKVSETLTYMPDTGESRRPRTKVDWTVDFTLETN